MQSSMNSTAPAFDLAGRLYQDEQERNVTNWSQIPAEEVKEDPLAFPKINAGVAGRFAEAYSAISEAPYQFYLMVFLAFLGAFLAGKITLKSLLKVQSRLFLILLGASGRGRKSTPISIVGDFFQNLIPDFGLMHNANSGEGLGVFLEKNPSTVLVFDEFASFVSKASQKNNTLLGAVTSFFEKNQYQTATKDKQLLIEDAYLSMVAACTTDTWERCWTSDFTAIGLVNRLFIIPGNMEKLVPIPPRLPLEKLRTLQDNTLAVIRHAEAVKEYELTEEGKALYDTWYREGLDHKSLHSIRLDAYALRFMMLLAVARGDETIQLDTVRDAIKLADWQHLVRQQYDPLDADTEIAKIEQRIRRTLSIKPRTLRELQQATHAQRSGLWIWKNALENLRQNEEVAYDATTKKYHLLEV